MLNLKKIIDEKSKEKKLVLVDSITDVYSKKFKIKEDNVVLSQLDSIIYGSLFKALSSVNMNKKSVICDYYLKELRENNSNNFEKYLLEISYLRDFFIYINNNPYSFEVSNNWVNNIEVLSAGESGGLSAFDACFENCIRKKASAVFDDGNWIDIAEFLEGLPVDFAWWIASCTWDCAMYK